MKTNPPWLRRNLTPVHWSEQSYFWNHWERTLPSIGSFNPTLRKGWCWRGSDFRRNRGDRVRMPVSELHSFRRKWLPVARAIAQGVVSDERWKSYRKLIAEVSRHEELTDRVVAAERKKRVKAMHVG